MQYVAVVVAVAVAHDMVLFGDNGRCLFFCAKTSEFQ